MMGSGSTCMKTGANQMGKLDGKIALVTGASKGIGAGVALSLAKEGAAVAVNYASDREGADRVVEKIKAVGGKAIAVQRRVRWTVLPVCSRRSSVRGTSA